MFSYKTQSIKFKLYVLNTPSGFENYVKRSLLARIQQYSLESYFGNIIIPLDDNKKLKSKRNTSKMKICFPGYIIIEAYLTKRTWLLIKQTPKVLGFVGNNQYPTPINNNDINNIKTLMATLVKTQKIFPYEIGDYVKIKKGPFMNLGGIIEYIDIEKRKVKIMISMFGRLAPIEVDILFIYRIEK